MRTVAWRALGTLEHGLDALRMRLGRLRAKLSVRGQPIAILQSQGFTQHIHPVVSELRDSTTEHGQA